MPLSFIPAEQAAMLQLESAAGWAAQGMNFDHGPDAISCTGPLPEVCDPIGLRQETRRVNALLPFTTGKQINPKPIK